MKHPREPWVEKKRNQHRGRSRGSKRRQGGLTGRKGKSKGDTRSKRNRRVTKRPRRKATRGQKGGSLDVQNLIGKLGVEFHVPGYQYLGPGTKLKKRLARGDPGINRLDRIAKQHDIDYSRARNLRDKHTADKKMVKAIDNLPGRKTLTERAIRTVIAAKRKLNL